MATMPFTPCDADPCADVTVNILQTVFGPVIRNLTLGSDPAGIDPAISVIATMMGYFNSGVLTVATLIVSFITVMGVINTANDGDAFGKNWSTLWTPVRIVAGAAVLLPTGTGYSFIQLLVMMFSLWAVGFANGTFKLGVENGIMAGTLQNVSQQIGVGSSATANKDYPLYNLREFASDYMNAAWCAKAVNSIYASGAVTGTNVPIVGLNGVPDRSATETGIKTVHTYEFKDRNATGALAGGNAVCGTVNLYQYQHVTPTPTMNLPMPVVSAVFDDAARNANAQAISLIRDAVLASKLVAVKGMMLQIDAWVNHWPADINSDWTDISVGQFNDIVNQAQGAMLSDLRGRVQSDNTLKDLMARFTGDITKDGWAMAGGYYQRLSGIRDEFRKIYSEPPGNVTAPALRWLPDDAKGNLARQSAIMPAVITRKAIDGAGYTPVSITDTGNVKSIIPVDLDDVDIDQMGERGNKYMNSLVGRFMESVTNTAIGADGNTDAMARIKTTGDILAVANATVMGVGRMLDTAATGGRVLTGAASSIPVIGSGISKVGDVLGEFVLRNFIQPLQEMGGWLDGLAFYFGVFLPSLPYAIFIIAVVGWLLAVLQTVFAAPLWAVMHMTPDRTFIGSQTQGYLMFLSLFMRPVLIIAALFAAMLLANPIILYVSKAFWAMRTANVSSSEAISFLVQFLTFKNWLIMYGFILLPIVYMIYGLTNALPDAILTWIGAGIKPLGETQATSEMRAGMERYGPAAAGAAGGALAGGGRRGALPNRGSGSGSGGGNTEKAASKPSENTPISDTGEGRSNVTADHAPRSAERGNSGGRSFASGAALGAGVAAGAGAASRGTLPAERTDYSDLPLDSGTAPGAQPTMRERVSGSKGATDGAPSNPLPADMANNTQSVASPSRPDMVQRAQIPSGATSQFPGSAEATSAVNAGAAPNYATASMEEKMDVADENFSASSDKPIDRAA